MPAYHEVVVQIPTLFEYAGGLEAFQSLTQVFYKKVALDPILAPVFEHMSSDHPDHVARFIAESFGGGPLFSQGRSPNQSMQHMVGKHLQRHLTEAQRRRWVELLVDSADEVHLPADPEFRSAFMAHIEWGTRIAVANSQLSENPTDPKDHIPRWGWGEVKGPYEVVGSICQFPLDSEAAK